VITLNSLNHQSFVELKDQRLVSADQDKSPVIDVADDENSETKIENKFLDKTTSTVGKKHSQVHILPKYVDKRPSTWERIIQSWEGRVIHNKPDMKEFVAIISDRTNKSNPDEEVVIGYESILTSDRELISEGAVFFWNFGRYRLYSESSGTLRESRKRFEIRFRRLPSISAEKAKEILEESKRIALKIHGH